MVHIPLFFSRTGNPDTARAGGQSSSDPYAAYLLYDTFTGTDGTVLSSHTPEKGGPWVLTGGYTIQANKAKKSSVAATRNFAFAVASVSPADCSFSVDMTGNGDSGIGMNVQDVDHLWMLWASGNSLFIYEESGKENFINRVSNVDIGPPFNIRGVTSGDTITLFRDGLQILTYNVASRPFKTSAAIAMITYTASTADFDNAQAVP